SSYVTRFRIQNASGEEPKLVNLREHRDARARLLAKGYVLDQGMVVALKGQYYHGADAIWILSKISTSRDTFNRLNYFLFSHHWLAVLVYPLLRMGRNLVLCVLGRKPLNDQPMLFSM